MSLSATRHRPRPRLPWAFVVLVAVAALQACAVGPNYHTPNIPTPAAYSELAPGQDPLSQPVASEADLSRWWTQLNDPVLNGLIARALAQNLNLKVAAARLRQARESVVVAASADIPHVSSSALAARVNDNSKSYVLSDIFGGGAGGSGDTVSTPSHLNLFAANLDASWEVDIFGGGRRSVQEADANLEAAVWRRRDGEVSLTAEVANDYLMLRALQAEAEIAKGEAETQAADFTIVRQQAQAGFITQLNINQQQAQVEATIAQIPALQAQARAQIHAIAVLLGQAPETMEAELGPVGPLPTPPLALPVGLPSDLLRRRPDIREAERELASATAAVGVQVANLYPKFNVMAFGPAFASTTTNHLFDLNNAASLGYGMIQWPIFEGGRVRANIRSARAGADQAYLTYQQTILSALQNVEDALARYRSDQQRIKPLATSLNAAQSSLTIARQQYAIGFVTYINILQAQAAELNAQNQLTQAKAQLCQDLASVYTAVGGGWSADEGAAMKKPGLSWP
jgi:NodT family efflux transporter outer membrane factor (OMF) lipoprotein